MAVNGVVKLAVVGALAGAGWAAYKASSSDETVNQVVAKAAKAGAGAGAGAAGLALVLGRLRALGCRRTAKAKKLSTKVARAGASVESAVTKGRRRARKAAKKAHRQASKTLKRAA